MPYPNPKQALAVFMDLKRRQGLEAAERFAVKHRSDMSKAAKANARDKGKKLYKSRSKRGK